MKKYGSVRIKLDELIEKRGISKNKLCHMAEMERTQLNNFCKNKITRLDTDVLARLCCALECKIEDILEYNPPKETE
ncbi:MAG: helix-turn-helix transcriptional regulator [Clostridia bacterium]|nr:helix-turn-helix transcriptional regulator [Clostridia bacterium]